MKWSMVGRLALSPSWIEKITTRVAYDSSDLRLWIRMTGAEHEAWL
jgi:hypothetical protein